MNLNVETLAAFEVLGVPAPQGSKTRMPNGALIEGGSKTGRAKHKAWRSAVGEAARGIAEDMPYDGPLRLVVSFRMPMPASRPKWVHERGKYPHSVKPDIDKLLRSTIDGLTDGGLIVDDARFYAVQADAFEVAGWTGASIAVARPRSEAA